MNVPVPLPIKSNMGSDILHGIATRIEQLRVVSIVHVAAAPEVLQEHSPREPAQSPHDQPYRSCNRPSSPPNRSINKVRC